jgi:hypothetical protein
LVIILAQETILVDIPMGGHLGYYSSTGGQLSYFIIEGPLSLVRESNFLWLVIILVHEAILIVIPTGGHIGYYPSMGGQQSIVEVVEDLRRHGMSPG